VVIALAVAFFYYASSFWITLLLSGFLAILVEPLVAIIEKLRVPRSVAATLVMPRDRAEELKDLHAKVPDELK